jgi:Tol biopolymer transport system component
LSVVGEPGVYQRPELSPDGSLAAVAFANLQGGQYDIWRMDLLRETSARLTFSGVNLSPVWSPDGRQVAYFVAGKGIVLKAASGAGNPRQLTSSEAQQFPTSWSKDGRFLLFDEVSGPTGWDMWALPLTAEGSAGPAKPFPYLKTRFNEHGGHFSPDGKWVAYYSDESGSDQVYVQGFPDALGKWQVSAMGAASQRSAYPRWRADGKELFFVGAGQKVMAVSVNALAGSFDGGKPAGLFPVEGPTYFGWGDTHDGQRFLVTQPKAAVAQPMTLLVNWQEALQSGR